jgi:hypothetical protein
MATLRSFPAGREYARVFAVVLLAACMPAISPPPAKAHAVYIFAWPEGGKICTESYFSKKSKVRGGEVRMEDATGTLLQSARTDDAGAVCFSAPEKAADLRFVVLAGEGHRGEFTLPAASTPLAASARDDGPTFRDILAGLGWIAGLTGLAAAYASRKKRS